MNDGGPHPSPLPEGEGIHHPSTPSVQISGPISAEGRVEIASPSGRGRRSEAEPGEGLRAPQPLNSFSDLERARWKEYDEILVGSLWLFGARDKSGPHVGDYWGNFVPQIPRQVLRRYTRQGDVVVDLFSGMGT